MSIPGSAEPLLLAQQDTGGYQIQRSLRFNSSDSAYLSRAVSTAGNRKTFTFACWVKLSSLSTLGQFIFTTSPSSASDAGYLYYSNNQFIYWDRRQSADQTILATNAVYRDPSAWYHVVLSVNYSAATSTDRAKIYVNGIEQTYSTATYPSTTESSYFNVATTHYISAPGGYVNAYLADIHFIDGQALDPSAFVAVSATTGQLIPKQYTGSFGTNGFWLKFSDNSAATATTLGKDYSGNNNNWSPSNLSVTAGAGNDSLTDTPTSYGTDTGAGGEVRGNYCTLNPLGTAGATPTNGNLSVSSSSTVGNRISTFFLTSGKWYWEGSGNGYVGAIVGRGGESFTGSISGTGSKAIGWWEGGPVYWDGGDNGGSTTFTSTDVIGIALDMDAGNIKFYKNNSLIYTITFGSGTVPNLSSGVFPAYNVGTSTKSVDLNFGQRPFAYTAPSGFKALCDTNLPAPVVAKSSTAFDVKTFSGSTQQQSLTTDFAPGFYWSKSRGDATQHGLYDIVRGGNKYLASNATDQETTTTSNVVTFNSNGVSLQGGGSIINDSGRTYVGWVWAAGSNTVSNTAGSITSTVSVRANPSAGFSIVGYSGASGGGSWGHGLGVEPIFIIFKRRNSNQNWFVFHKTSGSWRVFEGLNNPSADSNYSGSMSASSTVVSLPSIAEFTTDPSSNYIAYCWAPVAGYSSFGSYTGNGSADGPFVYTGHRSRWVLVKRTDSTSDWYLYDSARGSYNFNSNILYPNLSNEEVGQGVGVVSIDILSNGFKPRTATGALNASGGTYVWASFAESPFQYARAR